MKKLLLLAVCAFVLAPIPARADVVVTQFTWDRTGAEHLPCDGAVQWLLSPAHGVIDATVGVNDDDGVADGHAWTMLRDWQTETFYITSTEPVAPTDEVLVAYTGTADPAPHLSLIDCTEAAVVPPVEPPVVIPPAQPPTVPPATTTWDIGFRVTTLTRTNVVAKWRLVCSNGGIAIPAKGKVRAKTPLVRHLAPTIEGAESCHLTVRAWDIRPFARPHHPQPPVVTTWAIPSVA